MTPDLPPRKGQENSALPASLGFEAEAANEISSPPAPAWLRSVFRLRVYLPVLIAILMWGSVFGVSAAWWAVLFGWLGLHFTAYRLWHRERFAREVGLLREILSPRRGAVADFYRREAKTEKDIANPLPDLEAKFGERPISRADPAHHMRKRHARRLLRRIGRPGLRAGDVGCLAGEVSEEHVLAGHRVFLFDLDRLSLARAAETTERPVVQADASRLPVRPGAFELVTFLEVVEHISDPARAMREVADAVAPGGRLLASTDNTGCLLAFHLLNPLIWIERILGLRLPFVLPPRSLVKQDALTGKAYPHASFDAAQIRLLAEAAGLRLLWLRSYYFLPGFHRIVSRLFPGCTEEDYVRFALPLEAAFQRIPVLSRLGTHWIFLCEKPAGPAER